MTERDFLDAIDEDPGADDTHLVYADWLEEQGQDIRARLVRASVKDENSKQAQSLLTKCKSSWKAYEQWAEVFGFGWEKGVPRTISLKQETPPDNVLHALPEFPWISRIHVSQPPPADLVAALRERTRLHTLHYYGGVSDEGNDKPGPRAIRNIVEMATWRGLELIDVGLTNASLEHVGSLRDLRVLSLASNESLTDAGIARLKDLRELRELDLSYLYKVTGACLDVVLGNPELRRLKLAAIEGVDDSNVGRLSGLRHLRELDLARTGVTRYRLLRLLKCPKLKCLHLEGAMGIEEGEMREVTAFREEADAAGILVDMDWE